ncbi:MAG: trehalose-phosphatase [Pseudomonadota bacterium]
MQSALTLSAPPALATLEQGRAVALFVDFDGTLVELAKEPDSIAPAAGLADHLMTLAHRLQGRIAVVSGRTIDDIERHIGPLSIAVAGSHGSDIRSAFGKSLGNVARSLPAQIDAALRTYANENDVIYEHKAHGGALHFRSNPEAGESASAFAKKVASDHGWKAQSGKCVIEIVSGDGNKGSAVRTFMNTPEFQHARPFFVGDDLTDEAGFAACQELGGAGILVGERDETFAQYRLPDVSSVHTWLEI